MSDNDYENQTESDDTEDDEKKKQVTHSPKPAPAKMSSDDSDDDDSDDSDDDDSDDSDDSDDDNGEGDDDESDEDIKVTMNEDVTKIASLEAAKRMTRAHIPTTPLGNFAYMRTPEEIFKSGNIIPWDIVNPMGVHPKDPTQSIFAYDINSLPNTVEARPWTAPGADITDWFNYGFNETTWEKYRKKMLKIIKDKKSELKISILSEQAK